jgi:hypothetical protein
MSLNTDNKTRIDEYIIKHGDSDIKQGFPISLQGQKIILKIYRLPIDLLFYNIRNGRFAAEYNDLVKREGGVLQPEKKDDAKKIKRLLLELDPHETKRTYDDIKIRGQWNCGVITEDGYVIDGNRRMSIISKLFDDTGLEKWKFMDVARLDRPISAEDLWKLEAGIQLGKDEIVRYGPINELLKLREGVEAGLSLKEIVKTLYGYEEEEEVQEKLDRLDLIEQYLRFMGVPKQYSHVKNRVEHFINLQNIIHECRERDYEPDTISKIKYFTFTLIKEGIQHLELRKIRQMVEQNLTDAISEIVTAAKDLKPIKPKEKSPEEIVSEETEAIMDEFPEEEQEISPILTHFINATDVLDVSNNEGKEILLLSRAEKNLKPLIDYKGNDLSSPEAKSLIKKIYKYAEQLKKAYLGE